MDPLIGDDYLSEYIPLIVYDEKITLQINGHLVSIPTNKGFKARVNKADSCKKKVENPNKHNKRVAHVAGEKYKYENKSNLMKENIVRECCSKQPNSFHKTEMYVVSFPKVPFSIPTKPNHRGMKVGDLVEC
jgi:hypothetical protein